MKTLGVTDYTLGTPKVLGTDGRTDGRTEGVDPLLDLLSLKRQRLPLLGSFVLILE